MGLFMAPGLPALNMLKLAIIMYVRRWVIGNKFKHCNKNLIEVLFPPKLGGHDDECATWDRLQGLQIQQLLLRSSPDDAVSLHSTGNANNGQFFYKLKWK